MADKFLGIPYPVTKHAQGLFRAQGGVEQIKADLLALLLTNFGERVMLLDYGADLDRFIFEPNDDILREQVRTAITNAISKWEPRIVVSNINISIPSADKLNQDQTLSDVEHILLIEIDIFDPENIQEIEQIRLEVPLP